MAETEDEELHKSLAEIYAHAAGDAQHFRDKAGDEPIRQLKGMLRSPKPKVRCRACVALAKTSLIHAGHRPSINPTGQLLTATLSLFEKSLPPSVHRWAVEAFMWLSTMPDVKERLYEKKARLGSLVGLAESATKDAAFHYPLICAFRRLCVPRDKTDEQKKLEQEIVPR